jgi:hypothetical protein
LIFYIYFIYDAKNVTKSPFKSRAKSDPLHPTRVNKQRRMLILQRSPDNKPNRAKVTIRKFNEDATALETIT